MNEAEFNQLKGELDHLRGLVVNLQGIANGAEIEPVLRIAETSLFTALDRGFDDMESVLESVLEPNPVARPQLAIKDQ